MLDGGNVVAEVKNNAITNNYLRGVNLICRESSGETEYYLFNAHADVVTTTDIYGAVCHQYDYDAFGNEKAPDLTDDNPFRYCGEYLDAETGSYYLRARYYDPTIGRFTQEDTHWNVANMIYGDNPQKINEREDKLGLKTYTMVPQITAVAQAGNLYVYGINNPVKYVDAQGQVISEAIVAFIIANPEISAAILTGAFVGLKWLSQKLLDAIILEINKDSHSQSLLQATGRAVAVAAPASPDPNDDHGSSSNFKKYSAKEIERKYGMKSGQYHREVKENILKDLKKDSNYRSLLKKMGKNPDIYLSADGQIQIVSTVYRGRSFITQLYIQFYLP